MEMGCCGGFGSMGGKGGAERTCFHAAWMEGYGDAIDVLCVEDLLELLGEEDVR
jgi:hypothetical protein